MSWSNVWKVVESIVSPGASRSREEHLRSRRLEAEVDALTQQVNHLTEFRRRVEEMGVDPEAVEAFGKLAPPPSSPGGVAVRIVASPAFGPVNGAWPKHLVSGDKLNVTASVTVPCKCGATCAVQQNAFTLEVL